MLKKQHIYITLLHLRNINSTIFNVIICHKQARGNYGKKI